MDYDFIAKKAPINKTAARVMQKGIHYDWNVKDFEYHSYIPLKTIPFAVTSKDQLINDLKNKKFGSLIVIGYLGKTSGMGGKWLVKCRCGIYEVRKTRVLKKAQSRDLMCKECDKLNYLKSKKRG